MKQVGYIFRLVVCFVIGAYVFLLAFLNFSPTQRILTQAIAETFAEEWGTEVSIGSLEVGLFNRLILKDVCLKDKRGEVLLRAKNMSAKVSLRSIAQGPFTLRTLSLLDAEIHLYRQAEGEPLNVQFLIDAFSSEEKTEKSSLSLRVGSLILRRVQFSYDECYKPETEGRFNPAHLSLRNINANVSLRELTDNALQLRVRSLEATEQSGLTLSDLSFKFEGTRRRAVVENFTLRMRESTLHFDRLKFSYDVTKGFESLWPTLYVEGQLKNTVVALSDFRPFVRVPDDLDLSLRLNASFRVSPNNLQVNDFLLNEKDNLFSLRADAFVARRDADIDVVKARLHSLRLDKQLSARVLRAFAVDTLVQSMVERTGNVEADGTLVYPLHGRQESVLRLSTDVGRASLRLTREKDDLTADFRLMDIRPARLMANEKLPTSVTLSGKASASLVEKKLTRASADLSVESLLYRDNRYSAITLAANYKPQTLHFDVQSKAKHLAANLKGNVGFSPKGALDNVKIDGFIDDFSPAMLGLGHPLADASYRAALSADLRGLHGGQVQGGVDVRDFSMTGGPHGPYALESFHGTMRKADAGGQLDVESDFVDLSITGPLSVERARQAIETLMARALPGALPAPVWKSTDSWDVDLTLKRTDFLRAFLGTDLVLDSPLRAYGTLDASPEHSSLLVTCDGIAFGNRRFDWPRLYLSGQDSTYRCLVQTTTALGKSDVQLSAELTTERGALQSRVDWSSPAFSGFEGTMEAQTQFEQTRTGTALSTTVFPTTFRLYGSEWNILGGTMDYSARSLSFDGFEVCRPGQGVRLEGRVAKGENDSIVARLQNVDLAFVFDVVNFHAVDFGGKATGRAVFRTSGGNPRLAAHVRIPDFTFNDGPMGDTDLRGGWDAESGRIMLDADMHLPDGDDAGTKVKGYVSLHEKGLDLDIQAQRTDLRFLRTYMDGIFGDFTGNATGRVRLYGPFKQLDFDGDVVADARTRVEATGVTYSTKNGKVALRSGEFAFKDFHLTDDRGGTAQASGYLRHTHLKNLNYSFDVTAQHLLCYDQPETPDMSFYSTTVGSGNVRLAGSPGRFRADIALTPEKGTTLVYNLGTQTAQSKDDRMISFHDRTADDTLTALHPSDAAAAQADKRAAQSTGTDILLNFLLRATPDAEVRIITDPRTGDALHLFGEGTMRATFHNKGSFTLYGAYTLERGTYNLQLQDIIHRDLTLQKGSRLTFTGVPLEGDLDLKAVYTVNGASLSDLNYGSGFSNKPVRADCILNIGGKAENPQITFDLDLHNITEDEKQMVRQLIATEEDMSRQVIYLLSVGRFFSTANAATDYTASNQSAAAMRSILTSTLTGQLNQAISSALGTGSKWSFGANVVPGSTGWGEIEVDGLVRGSLFNDRLLFNGQFGYRDNKTYYTGFVGDFDLRYLLTPRGTVSLRAYSATNDRYFTKTALTTQGVGISLQRSFNSLKDLFGVFGRKKKAKITEAEGRKEAGN